MTTTDYNPRPLPLEVEEPDVPQSPLRLQMHSSAQLNVVHDLTVVHGSGSAPGWPAHERRTSPKTSIVILAYQEEARIGKTLIALSAHLTKTGRRSVEVIVVAATRPDGSSDRTCEIVEGKRALFEDLHILLPGPKAGKGRDAKYGMLAARGRVRVFMDADLATPLHHLDTALDLAGAGHSAVIGVRDLTSSHHGLRKVISSVGNVLVQAVLLPGIPDTQCGFKLFTAPATEQIFRRMTIDGWGFDMEVLAIARRLGVRVAKLAIPDWTDVAGGTFGEAPLSGTLRTLQDLFAIKWRVVSGAYRRVRPVSLPPARALEPMDFVPMYRAALPQTG